MSFTREPQPDACRALMPSPQPPPPGPPSVPMVCHMPKGHDGPHARERHPGPLSRRWEGDARCSGSGQRTLRGRMDEPDRCPVCKRIAYVRMDGTTGSHAR